MQMPYKIPPVPTLTVKQKLLEVKKFLERSGLLVFVVLPTVISALYNIFIASDIYVSEGKFSLETSDPAPLQMANTSGISSVFGGVGSSMQKLFVVKEFIHSNDMVKKLDERINLKELFNSNNADSFSRLGNNSSQEEMLEYFKDMTELRLDEHAGIINFRVKAFSAEDANKIATTALNIAEEFVNSMSGAMKQDAIEFSKKELENAEAHLIEQNQNISQFRNQNKNYNPLVSTQTVIQSSVSLESQLAAVDTEIAYLRNYMKDTSPRLINLKAKKDAIEKMIEKQGGRLASEGGSPLATITQDYTTLEMANQFALRRYEMSAISLEAAQTEARKKSIYLLRVDSPSKPDIAVEPNRIKNIITTLLMSIIIYVMARVSVSAIIDNVRK
jgi:capsular polysaccharide transport system permease protein